MHEDNLKLQKKRCRHSYKYNYKLKFGEFGFLVSREGRLEFVQLNFIKKYIKILFRKSKHTPENFKKVWYSLSANHVIQCKSKNSRMGKGKGLVERRIIRVYKNTILFEFFGISFYKLNNITKKINKKLNFKITLISNNINVYKNPFKLNSPIKYFNKYLLLD
jgi:ribosomal protein L16/L10AE